MIRVFLVIVTVLFLVLTGCTATVENNEYVSKEIVLEKAKEIETSPNVMEWKVEFVKNKEIIMGPDNTIERRTVWVVEALYPAGNRTVIIFDAETGEGLELKEIEP